MADYTNRIGLPAIVAGQVQKEIAHNEALLLLDLVIGGTLEAGASAAPPVSPVAASWYRIGSGASGEWFGRDGQLACLSPAGWRFVTPFEGLTLTERASGLAAQFRGGAWSIGPVRASQLTVGGTKVVGMQAAGISDPSGGASVDAAARTAIGQILAALRGHGLIAP